MTDVDKTELLNILISTNCPLLVRSDEWWVDELLFKSGKPRTELLQWVISKATNMYAGFSDLESTSVSSGSNSFKLPETDEAILEILVAAGICTEKELPFVQGNMPPEKQIGYWGLLLKPLTYLDKGNLTTSITFGCSALHSTVSMDNFFDAFTMKASLLPSDVQHEIQHSKKSQVFPESCKLEKPYICNLPYDENFFESFAEQVSKLKEFKEKYLSIYDNDLKISVPKSTSSPKLVDLGEYIHVINKKLAAWNERMDTIMDLGRRSNLESSLHRTETSLKLALKDQSFEPFKNLCGHSKLRE